MTPDLDLDAISKACEAATPEPLGLRGSDDDPDAWWICGSDGNFLAETGARGKKQDADNSGFIANARSWLPALVQRVRELEAANARLDKECGEYLNRIQHAHEEEREACAKIADGAVRDECSPAYIASAIRSRGEK